MHGGPQGHLHGFQIQPAVFMALLKDQVQETAYFIGGFLLDRRERFFSCGVRVCSTGRTPQILSLMATSSAQSS
jgi:hypothetical protein